MTAVIAACFYATALFAGATFSAPGSGKQDVGSKKDTSALQTAAVDSTKQPVDTLLAQPAMPQCTLSIKSDPAGAAVYLDDSLKGESPLLIPEVAPGNHILTLKKKGCFLKKAEITVDSATTSKELSFVLLQPGSLTIETIPAGAELWIDNKKEGTTPYQTGTIKPGDHSVKVSLERYVPQERTVTIDNGGRDSLKLTFEYTPEYKKELAAVQAAQTRQLKERTYLGIVSGLFVLGALVLVFIEAMGQ
jgi:hypothetical protein